MTGSIICNRLGLTAPYRYVKQRMTQSVNELLNQLMTEVFGEQPLALPGSPKEKKGSIAIKYGAP